MTAQGRSDRGTFGARSKAQGDSRSDTGVPCHVPGSDFPSGTVARGARGPAGGGSEGDGRVTGSASRPAGETLTTGAMERPSGSVVQQDAPGRSSAPMRKYAEPSATGLLAGKSGVRSITAAISFRGGLHSRLDPGAPRRRALPKVRHLISAAIPDEHLNRPRANTGKPRPRATIPGQTRAARGKTLEARPALHSRAALRSRRPLQ